MGGEDTFEGRVAGDAGMDLTEKGLGNEDDVAWAHEADGGECTASAGVAGVGVGDAFVAECETNDNFDSSDHRRERLLDDSRRERDQEQVRHEGTKVGLGRDARDRS